MSHIIFGNKQKTACILVYPMNYARTQNTVYPRKTVSAMIQKRVDKRSASVAGCGMDNHSLRLVDNEHTVIFISYIERNIFRLRRIVLSRLDVNGHFIVCFRLEALADNFAVDGYTAVFSHMLDARTGKLRKSIGDRAVYAPIGCFGINRKAQRITARQKLRHFFHLRRFRLSCRHRTDIFCSLLSNHIPS